MTDADEIPGVRSQERLETLNEISRVVSSTLDLRTLYDTIYQEISRVMDASQFLIALHHPGDPDIDIPYLQEDGHLSLDQRAPYGSNATSRVIDSGKPLRYGTGEEFLEYDRAHGLADDLVGEKDSESGIFVPLNTGSRTIGALTVQTTRPNAYSEDDVGMLSVIASQAAIAIENARLYMRSQDAVRETQVLLHIAQAVNSSLDLTTVLDAILSGVREVLPFYLASILLPHPSNDYLEIVGSIGPDADYWRANARIPFDQGVTGTVFTGGEPLIVRDVLEFPGYVSCGVSQVRSELAVPLKRGDTVIGVLNVEREEVGGFSEEDRDLLTLFASQAAIAIENARLFHELQNRVSDLQTIQSIVQKLTPVHDIRGISSVINGELQRLIDYHSWRMFIADPDDDLLIPVSVHGVPIHRESLRIGEGVTGWIARHGEPVLIDNLLHDPRGLHIEGTPDREESMIGTPMMFEGSVRGVLTLTKLGSQQFNRDDLRLLEIVAGQVAIAFDRARLYRELREEAITDPLTGLYNRRYLSERFREERSRALRNGHSLAAMMVDIDKFKRVNDTYGHDAGDLVLQELARVVRSSVRAEDIVARYGGEEFCILLPEIDPDSARLLGQRLREAIEHLRLPPVAGAKHVTVSVGIAQLNPSDHDGEIFARADQAMYAVKRAGGNQVCLDTGQALTLAD